MNQFSDDCVKSEIRKLTESVGEPAVVIDESGRLLGANLPFEEIAGFSCSELVGKPITEFAFLDVRSKTMLLKCISQVARESRARSCRISIASMSGIDKVFDVKVERTELNGRKMLRLFFCKASQRVRKESDVHTSLSNASEGKLSSMFFVASLFPLFILDTDGKVTDCNAAAMEILGYSDKKTVIGRSFYDFVTLADRQKAVDAVQKTLELNLMRDVEVFFAASRRFLGELSIAAIIDVYGKPSGFAVAVRDLSEKRNIEERAKAAQELLELQVNRMPIGLIVWDTDFRVKTWNPSATQIFGFAEKEALGKHPYDFIVPKKAQRQVDKVWKKLLAGDSAAHSVNENLTKDGRTITCFWCNTPLKKDDGTVIGVLSMVQDITETEKVEKTLRAAEEKFRIIFENVRDIVTYVDRYGRILEVNTSVEELLGYKREEILGRNFLKLGTIKPSDIPRILNLFVDALRKKEAKRLVQLELRHKNGRTVYAEVGTRVLREGQRIKGFVNIIRDVTPQKIQEMQLKSLKEFDDRILDSLGEVLLVIDPENYTILKANRTAFEQLKLGRNDVEGKPCYAVLHHESQPCQERVCPVRQVSADGNFSVTEHVHFDGKGNKVYFEISVHLVKDLHGKSVVIQVSKNVTERKRMEQALRESEETFRAISNAVKDALILVDESGRIVFWSTSAEKTFGYLQDEAVGRDIHSLITPKKMTEQKEQIMAGLKKFAETGQGKYVGETVELVARRKDGSEFPFKLSLSALSIKGKWHAVALARDITEQKRLRKQLEDYSSQLEQTVALRTQQLEEAHQRLLKAERLAAIGELAGMVGHDLRNPLTAIKNAVYYLKRKKAYADENEKAMLDVLDKSVEHANKIINDLMEYSKGIRLELNDCSPKELLQAALALIEIPENIKLEDHTTDKPLIKVDCEKVRRAFANIMKNAIEAMPNGGKLQIKSKRKSENIEFSFTDSGTGIPEENMDKLFTPLFTTKAQGMGFGLAICKRIIESHGGAISVRSKLGDGSTFTVTLPIKPKKEFLNENILVHTQSSAVSA